MITKFKEYEKQNEGWKEIALAGALFLSLPSATLPNIVKTNNQNTKEIVVNEMLSKEEVEKIIKESIKNGFTNLPGDIPVKMYIEKMVGGDYLIINTIGQTLTAAKLNLDQSIEANRNNRMIKSVYKLYKTNNKSVEIIGIVLLK